MRGEPTDIYLRADAPEYTVAMRFVDQLGFRLKRDVSRGLHLDRPVAGHAHVQLGIGIDDHRWDRFGAPAYESAEDGYDIWVRALLKDGREVELEDSEIWRLFDQICHELGYPALLLSNGMLEAAWSPHRGLRQFPPKTFTIPDHRSLWGDYALPRVTAPITIADDDVLGQLYAQVVADPEADGPRLAYADAVAADLPDYAELIRLQVEYAGLRRTGAPIDPLRRARMNQLEREHHKGIIPFGARYITNEFHIRRGFVEAVAEKVEGFPELMPDLVTKVPLRMVYFTAGAQERMAEIAALPQLVQLRGLSFWGNPIGDEGLRTLLSSPYLTGLRWLCVANAGVTEAGIEALAASDAAPQLRYVEADDELRLSPRLGHDYDGTLVHVTEPYLAMRLAQSYDRAWLHWQPKYRGPYDWVPEYYEV